MNQLKKINDQIRATKLAVSEAELFGVCGEEMLALKAELRRLKSLHRRALNS